MMDYQPVSSNTIAAVGYDDAASTLGVQFLNGTEYHYFGVPREIYDQMLGASSVGSYLNQTVKKGGYGYARVA